MFSNNLLGLLRRLPIELDLNPVQWMSSLRIVQQSSIRNITDRGLFLVSSIYFFRGLSPSLKIWLTEIIPLKAGRLLAVKVVYSCSILHLFHDFCESIALELHQRLVVGWLGDIKEVGLNILYLVEPHSKHIVRAISDGRGILVDC